MLKTTIERAVELARSGDCLSVSAIRTRLQREGYSSVMQHVQGKGTKDQLNALIRRTRSAGA